MNILKRFLAALIILCLYAGTTVQADTARPIYQQNGTYTPTLFNTTNIAASTSFSSMWFRIGNNITVFGVANVDPTTATSTITSLGVSLPVPSNFGVFTDVSGNCTVAGAVVDNSGSVYADTTNDRAIVEWSTINTNNHGVYFTFTYRII